MKKYLLALPLLALWLSACQPTPQPIDYGSDMCHFCKMTIVDQQHAAEAVTQKGKVFKFDAIECMVNFVAVEGGDDNFAFLLVNDFHAPKDLIEAQTSTYLISKNLPSPMGAFLTAFGQKSAASEMQQVKGGEVFDWVGMNAYLREQGVVRFSEKEY